MVEIVSSTVSRVGCSRLKSRFDEVDQKRCCPRSRRRIGSRVVTELRSRGHEVACTMRPSARGPVSSLSNATPAISSRSRRQSRGTRCLSALSAARALVIRRFVVDVAPVLLAASAKAGLRKLVVVGGAGSLLTSGGVRLIDSSGFEQDWKPASQAQIDALDVYRASDAAVSWVYVSPSDLIAPGKRTGNLEYGTGRS